MAIQYDMSREYWNVVCPILGENYMKHFYDFPLCVALSPRTPKGLNFLASVRFQNLFRSKSHLNLN
jgi:hypothetical protein